MLLLLLSLVIHSFYRSVPSRFMERKSDIRLSHKYEDDPCRDSECLSPFSEGFLTHFPSSSCRFDIGIALSCQPDVRSCSDYRMIAH